MAGETKTIQQLGFYDCIKIVNLFGIIFRLILSPNHSHAVVARIIVATLLVELFEARVRNSCVNTSHVQECVVLTVLKLRNQKSPTKQVANQGVNLNDLAGKDRPFGFKISECYSEAGPSLLWLCRHRVNLKLEHSTKLQPLDKSGREMERKFFEIRL